jgi:dipeptidyl aminopeptidase/acylaminoacyl peptidase
MNRHLFCWLCMTSLMTLWKSAGAQISLNNYLSVPFPSHLVSSSDGKSVAWVFNNQGERNIFLAEAPAFEAKQLTVYKGDDGVEISQLHFVPGTKWLVFVRGNAPNAKGEPANPAQLQQSTARSIYRVHTFTRQLTLLASGNAPAISADGKQIAYLHQGEVYQLQMSDTLARPAKMFTARGGIGQLQWHPSGSKLAFVSNRGDHSFVGIYDAAQKKISYPETSLDFDSYPAWSPDGSKLAYLRIPNADTLLPFTPVMRGNPWSIRVLDLRSGNAQEVFKADTGIGSFFVDDLPATEKRLWWKKNEALVFPWERNGWMQLYTVELATRNITHLTPGEGEVEMVANSQGGTGLYYTANIGNLHHRAIWFLDWTTWQVKKLTPHDKISFAAVGVENGMACLQSSDQYPAWPVYHTAGKAPKELAPDQKPAGFPNPLMKPELLSLTASDGFKTQAQLFLPANYTNGKKYPAVIFLHGGSRRQMLMGFHYGQYYSHAYAMQQFFAANGFIALTVNFRSGIGYGVHFREARNYGAAGASEVQDVMAAAAYLAERNDVDPGKIIPWGGSYGGYLTAHALSQAPGRFLCGVDIHGVHNWNHDIPVFAGWYKPEKYPNMAKLAFQSSPMNYVAQWREPVLLIHGDDDRNVLFSESVELAELLRRKGVHVEQLVFPDEVHSFLLHKNWLSAYEASFQFVQRMLRRGQP